MSTDTNNYLDFSNCLILIADDQQINLKILSTIINPYYKYEMAADGIEALAKVQEFKPDLVLLDIMMPGMNGYDVCTKMKENYETANIPVIFITALNNLDDIIKGFEVGGVDYVTKPFKKEELLERIKTHIALKKSFEIIGEQYDKLNMQNQELIEMQEELSVRNEEIYFAQQSIEKHAFEILQANARLEESEEILQNKNNELMQLNAEKDKFFSIISHDLRNPFASIVASSKMLYDNYDSMKDSERKDTLLNLNDSSTHLMKLLENLLEWARMKRGLISDEPDCLFLNHIIQDAINVYHQAANNKEISINNLVPNNIYCWANISMITTVVRNLLSNSIKFSHPGDEITIGQRDYNDEYYVIYVEDHGIGIPKENMEKIFKVDSNILTIGTAGELSTGLGLPICMEFVKKNNGDLWVESEENVKTTFYFTLKKHFLVEEEDKW